MEHDKLVDRIRQIYHLSLGVKVENIKRTDGYSNVIEQILAEAVNGRKCTSISLAPWSNTGGYREALCEALKSEGFFVTEGTDPDYSSYLDVKWEL